MDISSWCWGIQCFSEALIPLDLDRGKTVAITCFHSFTEISMDAGRAAQSLINTSVVRAHSSQIKNMLHRKSRRVALTAN